MNETTEKPQSVTPKSGDARDKTMTAVEASGVKMKGNKALEPPKGTHVANETCITFSDVNNHRVHAAHGDYVTPCDEDKKSLLRKRAILPVALWEAKIASDKAVAEAMADMGE